jgi:predicted acylesterase/phospholipase RssA
VSVGAINGSLFAAYDYGEEKKAVADMEELYSKNEPFFEFWPTIVLPPFWKSSITDNTGMKTVLNRELPLERKWKRAISIQSVDLNTGAVVIFDETIPLEIRTKVIMSSAAIPAFFPPIEIDDLKLVDGGVFQNISLGDPIAKCREKVNDDTEIIVDLILCFEKPIKLPKWEMFNSYWKDAKQLWNRSQEVSNYYFYYEDVLRVTRGYPNVKFRHIVAPTVPVPDNGYVPIFSTKENIKKEIAIGYEDGLKAIEHAKKHGSNLEQLKN